MNHWLFKTEPHVFSIEDLQACPNKTARWDEIRNYQARNFLRDEVKNGDTVLIYHSQCKPTAIVGAAKVVKPAYPDPSQFDPSSEYFDPKATPDKPRWFCVDIQHTKTFHQPVTLATIKNEPALGHMVLIKQGRLSVQPVTSEQAHCIHALSQSFAR